MTRAKAPLRVSFCGGGTDIAEYFCEHGGGVVLNATITKYAYATLVSRDDQRIILRSVDYGSELQYNPGEAIAYDGDLDLAKAAIKRIGVHSGVELFLHTDAPPGSGLGSSSTLTAAIIGAFQEHFKLPPNPYHTAELAYAVEREELGLHGGKQDQYAAVFGGINFIEFFPDRTIVNPLRLRTDVINELQYRLVLYYTGRSRVSGKIIEDQIRSFTRRDSDVLAALHETKQLTVALKQALLLGDLDEMGRILHEAWQVKQRFSSLIAFAGVEDVYEAARAHGAIGGKLLGAGGGGYMLFLCANDARQKLVDTLRRFGGAVEPLAFELEGIQSWQPALTEDIPEA
jgi:D-glycero-alpha-D-manno-heptose-7-phosphate kinase